MPSQVPCWLWAGPTPKSIFCLRARVSRLQHKLPTLQGCSFPIHRTRLQSIINFGRTDISSPLRLPHRLSGCASRPPRLPASNLVVSRQIVPGAAFASQHQAPPEPDRTTSNDLLKPHPFACRACAKLVFLSRASSFLPTTSPRNPLPSATHPSHARRAFASASGQQFIVHSIVTTFSNHGDER